MTQFIQRAMPAIVLFALGTLLALYLVPSELAQMEWEVPGMPETYPIEQKLRPILLLLLCYLPFIGAVGYGFMGTMDRYMSRNFITYFLMCTLILLLIYILADFTDNMERFRKRFDDPVVQSLRFYGSQLPFFLYQILPYTLMVGVLWSMSKLSGTCEITGMMQSGRSLLRLCRPIFFFSALVSVMYGIFGFHWAPNGSLYRQLILKRRPSEQHVVKPIVYRSEANARIWHITKPADMSNPGAPMRELSIDQFDTATRGRRIAQYIAEKAVWNKADATWTFTNCYIRRSSPANVRPQDDEFHETLTVDFNERPYQIITPSQTGRIDAMGSSVMYEFIASGSGSKEDRCKIRTEWHVRIARIFSCMVLVLMAIPSSVTFQRRGTMKGIGIAVILSAFLLFFYRVFPSLGEAGLIQAWISAWIPNVCYLVIAIYIFYKNLAHRTFREWLHAKLHGKP